MAWHSESKYKILQAFFSCLVGKIPCKTTGPSSHLRYSKISVELLKPILLAASITILIYATTYESHNYRITFWKLKFIRSRNVLSFVARCVTVPRRASINASRRSLTGDTRKIFVSNIIRANYPVARSKPRFCC